MTDMSRSRTFFGGSWTMGSPLLCTLSLNRTSSDARFFSFAGHRQADKLFRREFRRTAKAARAHSALGSQWTTCITERIAARVWSDGCQQGHRTQYGPKMARSLAAYDHGYLCKRSGRGGAVNRLQDVDLITPGRPIR